jgi:hypothetical protein
MSVSILPVYAATVEQVTSGDDLVLLVDLGVDNLFKKTRARLHGVDTPDAYKAPRTTPAGQCRELVRGLTLNKRCTIEVHSQGRNGWIVTLFVHTGTGKLNVNDHLRTLGFVYQRLEAVVDEAPQT